MNKTNMKRVKTIVTISMLIGMAKAQYALQIGSRLYPIKSGDEVSKQALLRDTVRFIYLPDTSNPMGGIENMSVLLTAPNRTAKVFFVPGNLLFPAQTKSFDIRTAKEILIQQTQRYNGVKRPVMVRLILIE
jgi:hypothetical protein